MYKISENNHMKHLMNVYFSINQCPICESRDTKVHYPIDSKYAEGLSGIHGVGTMAIGVAACKNCKHQFIQPCPRPNFLTRYYSSYMSKAKVGFYQARYASDIPDSFRNHYEPWLKRIQSLLSNQSPVLLDIGCGLGMFLRLARNSGFKVRGLEPNAEAVKYLNTEHNIHAYNTLLEDYNGHETFDVICMWDLLEHLANPGLAVKKVNKILNPGGLLVLEIPVRDSLLHWVAKVLYKMSFGCVTRPLFLTYGVHHLQYFSEKSIVSFLERNSFEVCECSRTETDISALKQSGHSFYNIAYNAILVSLFALARIFHKENKVILLTMKK